MFSLSGDFPTAIITTAIGFATAAIVAWFTHRGIKTKGEIDRRTEAEKREDAAHARGTEAQIKFVEQMQRRCSELESYIDNLVKRVMAAEGEANALNRRWRHLVNGLITYASILKARAEAVGVALPPFNGFARFEEEGGQLEEHWRGHLGLGEDEEFPAPTWSTCILVIDDDRAYTRILSRAIRSQLHEEVHVVSSAREAAACMRLGQFRVAILDLNLPDGYGLDIATQARAEGCRIPVIVLTGDAVPALSEQEKQNAGVVEVLSKSTARMVGIAEHIRRYLNGGNGSH